MQKKNKIVIYGTGSCAREILSREDIKSNLLGVVDKDNKGLEQFDGRDIQSDAWLTDISEDFDLVVGSQYFEKIITRLSNENKLHNIHLKKIYVPDLLMQKAPYDGEKIEKISKEEWRWLKEQFEDVESKRFLDAIIVRRTSCNYPQDTLAEYDPNRYNVWGGNEDYWDTIQGSRRYDDVIVIDAGAYIGDSISKIVNNVGGYVKSYYALEPMSVNYERLEKVYLDSEKVKQFIPLNVALGRQERLQDIFLNEDNMMACSLHENNTGAISRKEQMKVITLDSLDLHDKADYFVKMDIEGNELDALMGGSSFIRNTKPNLAICLYHKQRDIIDIPRYLRSVRQDYQFHLVGGSHTILIAN